jgi:pyruvate dehydrogenase E1 component beta subunit
LWEEFGNKRVINTPIAESGFTGAAVGAAITGMRPIVCHGRVDFMLYAYDAIVNQAAKWRFQTGYPSELPLVIRVGTGGYRGSGCHHSQSLESLFINIPGLSVVIPSTPYDAKGLLKTAFRSVKPVLFFEHSQLGQVTGEVPTTEYCIPFGKADVKSTGKDVTIVATAFMVHRSLKVAGKLSQEGIKVEVIDLRSLAPMDRSTIVESVQKTGRLVTVEEGVKTGGIGSEISGIILEEDPSILEAPSIRVANPDSMLPYKLENEKYILPQDEDIELAVRNVLGKR